ncbi:MAG: hypothetical protein OSJ24_04045 [Muribaculaceae bacterium]|nr:hypothetical protein [Muribaculaceae bacterium]
MLTLTCKIEIRGEKRWTIKQVHNVRIVRDIDSIMDTCEIEITKKILWDGRKECPLKRGDFIVVYLGYDNNFELAFKGRVLNIYQLDTLKIFCGNEMCILGYENIEIGTEKSEDFKAYISRIFPGKKVRIDETIRIGQFYQWRGVACEMFDFIKLRYNIRTYYILEDGEDVLCFGNLNNDKIKAVYDTEKNIVKHSLKLNREYLDGYSFVGISINAKNEKIRADYLVGQPPYRKRTKVFRYYNLTQEELNDEMYRMREEFFLTRFSGDLTVFGSNLIEKYDLIGLKRNGEKLGMYRVVKNVITFGLNGYRQKITLGNEKR